MTARLADDAGPRAARPARGAILRDALAEGRDVEAPAAVVVAHPDDETLGLGLALPLLRNLVLVTLTDGAPRDMVDARALGLRSRRVYARERRREQTRALRALGVQPRRHVRMDVVDQETVLRLGDVVARLEAVLSGLAAVLVHAYEGGHPDHDAAALCVQAACRRLGPAAPARLEFAGYHAGPEGRVVGRFVDDPARPARPVEIPNPTRLSAKAAALEAYRTQRQVAAWFDPAAEAYREAPDYDPTRPPPGRRRLWEDWGLSLSGAEFDRRVRAAFGAAAPADLEDRPA